MLNRHVLPLSKFRGCLFTALAGDCIGEAFGENRVFTDSHDTRELVQNVSNFTKKGWSRLFYTDDTAMARNVALSLLEKDGFDGKDMAERFMETYFRDDKPRNYGAKVVHIFLNWKENHLENFLEPAKLQFEGKGSYGNGAAMRVAPVSLFHSHDLKSAVDVAREQSLLTHTYPDAVMGAVLIAASVHVALNSENHQTSSASFLHDVEKIMLEHQAQIYSNTTKIHIANPFIDKFQNMFNLIETKANISECVKTLGNGVDALSSVSAAIFAFVRCLENVDGFKAENPIIRTLSYAIAMGGDSDTIATMTGAIAGAFYGDQMFPSDWLSALEGLKDYSEYAERFFQRSSHAVL